jgi:hypothetical protein
MKWASRRIPAQSRFFVPLVVLLCFEAWPTIYERIRLPDCGRWGQMYDFSENLQEWARLWHDRNVEAVSSFGVRSPPRPGVSSGTTGQALRQIERQRCQEMGPAERRFSSGVVRVLPCATRLPVSLLFVVALTGIEPATLQFRSVQLGLSSCVFGLVQFATKTFMAVWRADVLPWWCPAVGI